MNTLIQTAIEWPQKDLLAKLGRPSIRALTFIALTFACFALSPTAEAANDSNTKLGKDALKVNTTGTNDTALGYQTLKNNTTGSANTATGSQALFSNTVRHGPIQPKEPLPFIGILPAAATSPWAPAQALI